MNKKLFLIPIILGIIAVISFSLTFVSNEYSVPESQPIYDEGFTYYDIETIQTTLAEQNIVVSTPVAITDHTVNQYCKYFEKGLPRTVEYCTTTSVSDSEGRSMGNINLGGTTNSPILAIANLETSTLDSNKDEVFGVFETMIETLVCDCWEEKSEDFESISAWLNTAHNFYKDSDQQKTVKSQIGNLGDAQITLEITPKENSILQTLIILK